VPAAAPRVVVLGFDHPSALGIIQSFGRMGASVAAVDESPDARGFRSRYVTSRHVVEPTLEAVWHVLDELRPGGGVILPTDDHYLTALSQRAESLAESFVVPVPSWETMGPLLRRPRCLELAAEAGLRIPPFQAFRDAAHMDAAIAALDPARQYLVCRDDFSRPCVVDTAAMRSIKVSGPGIEAVRRDCHDVLARTGQLPVIVEILPGASEAATGVVAVVDRRHEVVLAYCLRRRPLVTDTGDRFVHPYDLGWTSHCESVVDEEAVAAARALVRHVRYFGVAVVEFRRDARDGGLVFVKLDARIDRAVALGTALGMDVPRAVYDVFVQGRTPAAAAYPAGVRWLWPSRYATDILYNRHRVAVGRELARLAAAARQARAFAYLGRDDPRPFLHDLARWVRSWARRAGSWARRQMGAVRGEAAAAPSDGPPGEWRGRPA
jgi:predicted ATP-grasp superfamily ATP-dependent carboligase